MKTFADKLIHYREVAFFTALLLWAAIGFTLEMPEAGWEMFFQTLLVLGIVMMPVILFVMLKRKLQDFFSAKEYLLCWCCFFLVLLPTFAYVGTEYNPFGYPGWMFSACATWSILLELLLIVNDYYRKKIVTIRWMQGLGLEKAILISIAIISVALSAMAVSSMDNPLYNTNGHLLIALRFIPGKLVEHFGTFIVFTVQFLLMYLAGYLFFLVNSRFLVPKVLKQYGLIIYILSMLTVVVILYPVIAQILISLPINDLLGSMFPSNPFVMENAAAAVSIILLSLPVILSQQWTKQNNQITSLEKEKAQAELNLLKQQINPHFLFNTLNNLYALSLQHSTKTSDSILQLSELMRYVIYKGNEEKVKLRDELKYIQDFMDLQQIRLKKPLALTFERQIDNQYQLIAPLLLIVLVENAFKHGIEPSEETAFLVLRLKTENKKLFFSCENSFERENTRRSGIGLTNLRKRLDLLYPGRHSFKTEIKDHTFRAELQIDLS